MVLDLALLGVSREYESEADQLGVQYAWKSGYAPLGFTTFFDKMASEKGYVRSASFFRTHPPDFDRILSTFSEIEYLPAKKHQKVDSTEFHAAKDRILKIEKETEPEQRNRPTLRRGDAPQCPEEELASPAIS
jgi:beta-barrel assembly-enhancing protease